MRQESFHVTNSVYARICKNMSMKIFNNQSKKYNIQTHFQLQFNIIFFGQKSIKFSQEVEGKNNRFSLLIF